MLPYIDFLGIKIPSYGMCALLGIIIVLLSAIIRAKKKGINYADILAIAAVSVLGAYIGGTLLYIVTAYSVTDIINYISRFDFSFISSAGLVFYGGLIGGVVGAFLGSKIISIKLSDIEDDIVPFIPFGHAVGRVGCFLSGCCYGIEYKGIFAITYTNPVIGLSGDVSYFPVQLLEAFLDIMIVIILLIYSRKKRKKFDLLSMYMFLYAILRFCTEFLRGDEIRGLYFSISTSQWISIVLIVAIIVRNIYCTSQKESINKL